MFNHILATILGITAIILGIVATVRFELLAAKIYDQTTTKEERDKDVYDFLNALDDTRSNRYAHGNRKGMMRQFDGFRSEWNSFMGEFCDNFELDMAY